MDAPKKTYTTPLSGMIEEFSMTPVFLPPEEVQLSRTDLNRPGLALSGFYEMFEPDRVDRKSTRLNSSHAR